MTDRSPTAMRRQSELGVFLVLSIVLAPLLSIAAVGSYGFAVWMYQLVAGPPSIPTNSPPPRPLIEQL